LGNFLNPAVLTEFCEVQKGLRNKVPTVEQQVVDFDYISGILAGALRAHPVRGNDRSRPQMKP
jgi:hypothetical protein